MSANCSYKSQKEKTKRIRYVPSVSWRLFGALVLFVTAILAVIWIFQIFLFDRFYKNSKLEGLYAAESEIVEALADESELRDTAKLLAVENRTCIKVYQLTDGDFRVIADNDVNLDCEIHHSADGVDLYYGKAVENGGAYIHTRRDSEAKAYSTVMVSVKETDTGVYVIMQDVDLQPLDSMLDTQQRQFGWITCILIMGAMMLALVLSRMICQPMQEMGQAASRLANGDYDARFPGGGYKEAEELSEAFNYAANELQKTDQLQKQLIANVSHDLRTPLTMIKGYSEMMRDIPGENTPENVQVIIDETQRLTDLVNDVLDLSKIKSGTRGIELEVFDLTEAISALLMRYERFTDNQYVINFVHDESVFVRANRNMILQATYNLVNNAINYTGDDKTVIISQRVSDGRVRISVTDTGKGIAKEDLPYIWDRYYRVDKVHKRAVVGTGLGLSIVKGVLEAHHANFGVESELGVGSTFYFELNAVHYDYAVSKSNAE